MYRVYQLLPGDTLDSIAKKYNISTNQLLSLNGLDNNSTLSPGSYIVVPSNASYFDEYVIQKGDSLYSIAKKYNIPLEIILSMNGLDKDNYIYPGEKIIIPKENVDVFITKDDDTLNDLVKKIDVNKLLSLNDKVYLLPNQLLFYIK